MSKTHSIPFRPSAFLARRRDGGGIAIVGGIMILLHFGAAGSYAQTLTTLASFNGNNGQAPASSLIIVGGNLYGTTSDGGTYGTGTVFSLPIGGGTPTVLASVSVVANGVNEPYGGASGCLVADGGTLYGATYWGGDTIPGGDYTYDRSGLGTIFSVPMSGGTIDTFALSNLTDGAGPAGGLTLIGNTLYCATTFGGANGSGTVISVPANGGSVTLVASLNGSGGNSGLTLGGNTFYGTDDQDIYSLSVSGGAFKVLANDGWGPVTGNDLTLSGNTLYGSDSEGVFSLSTSGGNFKYLAPFNSSSGLTLIGDTLYGTTSGGGAYGDGFIFSLPVTGGTPSVVVSFTGSNGANPVMDRGFAVSGNTLYGTTNEGGAYGDGTVFALNLGLLANTWSDSGGGSWNTPGNWTVGIVPNGVGAGAVFNLPTTAPVTVTLNTPVTLGSLQFGNSGNASVGYTLSGSGSNTLTLNNSGNGATITVTDGTHAINAPVILADNLTLTTGSTNPWTLSFGTTSSITDNGAGYSLTMSGTGGTLILSGSDSYTGGTFVEAGTLIAASSTALPDGSSLTIGAGGTFIFNPSVSGSPVTNSVAAAAVPEPSTLIMLGIGAIGLLGYGSWRRTRKRHLSLNKQPHLQCSALCGCGLRRLRFTCYRTKQMFEKAILRGLLTVAVVASAVSAHAGVISIAMVPVRDAGNVADPATGYGAVSYDYNIGKYDVTVGQYVAFLNSVATKSDPYGLYNANMALDASYDTVGITRNGSAPNYSYSVTGTAPSASNMPVFAVTWGDAARFCNWLQDGQPTSGTEATGTTGSEKGSELFILTRRGASAKLGECHAPLRPIADGLIYHVINRGNNRQPVFESEGDFLAFLKAIADLKERKAFDLYGYCLMTNHILC